MRHGIHHSRPARSGRALRRTVGLATVAALTFPAISALTPRAHADTVASSLQVSAGHPENCPAAPLRTPSTEADGMPDGLLDALTPMLGIAVPGAWQSGILGRQPDNKPVDIALIDTGSTPMRGLDSTNLIQGPDLSFESQTPSAHLDGYGHGTHLAGLMVGHEPGATDASLGVYTPTPGHLFAPLPTAFQGVAPRARVVSVKVGDSTGAADVTQVIAAIDWAVAHRRTAGLNIRVLNLSIGINIADAWSVDALNFAVDQAWKAGIARRLRRAASRPEPDNAAFCPNRCDIDLNGGATEQLHTPTGRYTYL
jgi:serine protease AprX